MLELMVIGGAVIALWPGGWYAGTVLILVALVCGPRVTHCFCFLGPVEVANPYLVAQGVLAAALGHTALRWRKIRPTPPAWLRRIAIYAAVVTILSVAAVLDKPDAYDALDFARMSLVTACALLACMETTLRLHRPALPTATVKGGALPPDRTGS